MTANGNGATGGGPSGLTRRRLLAGLGGVGAIGMASGAGTFAHFSDAEAFADNAFGAGDVDIDVWLDASCRGCVVNDDGRVRFGFDDIDRGDDGHTVLSVDVQTNPSRLWLGTQCLPVPDPLGDAIEATLTVGGFSQSGSLSDLRRQFAGGLRLDDLDGDACLDPTSGPLEIVLDWRLPTGTPDSVAESETSFDIQLYAEQCRHVSEDEAVGSNPFAAFAPCDEPPACVVCDDDNGGESVNLQTLTFRYEGTDSAHLEIVSTKGNTSGVLFAGDVQPADEFTIDGEDVERPGQGQDRLGPEIRIDQDDGEEQTDVHVSCSKPLAVGMTFGDGGKYVILEGITTDGRQICAEEDL